MEILNIPYIPELIGAARVTMLYARTARNEVLNNMLARKEISTDLNVNRRFLRSGLISCRI